jgi:hypothetical protein
LWFEYCAVQSRWRVWRRIGEVTMQWYLIGTQFAVPGDGSLEEFERRVDALMAALLDLEQGDEHIVDPDLSADVVAGTVDVELTVRAESLVAAVIKQLTVVRAAIHQAGGGVPGWEQVIDVVRVVMTFRARWRRRSRRSRSGAIRTAGRRGDRRRGRG